MSPTVVVEDIRPLIALLAPWVGLVGIIWAGEKRPNLRELFTFIAASVQAAVVLSLVPLILSGAIVEYHIWQIFSYVPMLLRVDGPGILFASVASILWIATTLYSIGYMRGLHEHSQTRFYSFFALSLSATMGVAFSANLLTIYFFYEMLSVSTFPLVTHMQDKEARTGGRTYLGYLLFTSLCLLLPALSWCYVWLDGGHLTMDFIADVGKVGHFGETTQIVLLFLFTFGFAKAGLMPFHHWLPGAMVAPTPVSALLHAVAVVKVGVFSTTRVMLYVFGVDTMSGLNLGVPTAYFVSFTILMASIIALSKDNLKARLAYSTVSQLSYIILGVALLTPTAIEGGLIHITNHAFSKITLFFCAGAIYVASHKKNISEMSGLGRTMPFTFAAFGIASLSMIGAPPVAGFVTKWKLLVGTMEMEAHYVGILLVLLASTLLNAAYFAPVTYKAFFGKRPPGEKYEGIKEAPLAMVIPIMIAAIISVLIGIFPGFMMKFVDRVTPDNVAVAMPHYDPAGAPKFIPAVDTHGVPVDSHGKPVDTHEAPE